MRKQDKYIRDECKSCSENPDECHTSRIYKKASEFLKKSKKHDIYIDARGMSCSEIILLIKKRMYEIGVV